MSHQDVEDLFFAADKKAKQKIFDNICKGYWEDKLEELGVREVMSIIGGGSLPPIVEERLNYVETCQGRRQWGDLSAKDTSAVFVTISPPPGSVTAVDLLSMSQKCFKNFKHVAYWYWCVEQGGSYLVEEPPLGYHPHVHALAIIAGTPPEPQARNEVSKRVKYHFGKIPTKNFNIMIQLKAVSAANVAKKLAYIEGNKTDPAKKLQVQSDVVWRDYMGLQHIYTTCPAYRPPVVVVPTIKKEEKESDHYLGSDSSSVSSETD